MILGIDIGTTTIGWCVNENKIEVESNSLPSPSKVEITGENYIQSPDVIFDFVKSLIDDICKKYDVDKIAFSTQMHGVVICDKNGCAISPFFTWQDKSAQKYVKETGTPSGYGLATIYALIKENRLPSDSYKVSTIADYVSMKLCKKTDPIIHVSNAASFGLFDIENNEFDRKKCEMLGIPTGMLPIVVKKPEIVGEYKNIPCYVALGDNQASVLACIGEKEGGICLNYGTGSQISYISNMMIDEDNIEVRPYINGLYLNCASALCGGRAYAVLNKFFRDFDCSLTDDEIYAKTNFFAMQGIDAPLVVNTRFAGTRKEPNLLGSIINISENNFTPQSLCAGVLFGMANELHDYYKDMGSPSFTKLVASGGVVKKCEAFREILSRVFQCEIEISNTSQEAAFGSTLFVE